VAVGKDRLIPRYGVGPVPVLELEVVEAEFDGAKTPGKSTSPRPARTPSIKPIPVLAAWLNLNVASLELFFYDIDWVFVSHKPTA
jgi:hypothetical protein